MEKRLYRARDDRWIAGVCGGLGKYLGVDSTLVRIGFILLAFWNGFGILLYILMALIVPEEPLPEIVSEPGLPSAPPSREESERRLHVLGLLLILGGLYVLMRNLSLFPPFSTDRAIALALIAGGILLLILKQRGS
ncbi:MAG: PspC domain-containing protein [Armatimonadota bacterium]|nr:PspC domain-containing protein [Armatimonadota bacterium]MDR5703268.1 PspC domain-containing protein [Armatimonadota bacterium]MDR7435270.1 PspC domain-containing protein [Armatimonadota bacterium]